MVEDLAIPPRLARTAVEWEGEAGRAWLARLPRLVDELVAEWDLHVAAPLHPGGQVWWVAPARRRGDDLDAVLKVQLPHPESAPEAIGLAAWRGDGAVHLYAHDPLRCALLVERCRPGEPLAARPGDDDAARVGAALGGRLHRAAPPPGTPSLAAVLDLWADELDGRLPDHGPADPAMGRLAVDVFRQRPRAASRTVLLHGDLNPGNVLAAARQPWLAIDPKPMVGDPAWDGVRIVTQPDPRATPDPAATVARRLAIVADGLGVRRDDLALWCVAGVVEMATSARAHGAVEDGVGLEPLIELLRPHLP